MLPFLYITPAVPFDSSLDTAETLSTLAGALGEMVTVVPPPQLVSFRLRMDNRVPDTKVNVLPYMVMTGESLVVIAWIL